MSLLAYKINEDHLKVADPTCELHGDQLDYETGQMPLVIDVPVCNVVTPGIIDKRRNLQLV